MGVHGGGTRRRVGAGRLRVGDRLVLDGFTREVVHVQRFGGLVEDQTPDTGGDGAVPVLQVRVSFINGSSITVPTGEVFEVVGVDLPMVGSGR